MNKPLSFHLENLKNNDIKLNKTQIKYLLQKIRENNFPKDEDYLNNISKIRITLDLIIQI